MTSRRFNFVVGVGVAMLLAAHVAAIPSDKLKPPTMPQAENDIDPVDHKATMENSGNDTPKASANASPIIATVAQAGAPLRELQMTQAAYDELVTDLKVMHEGDSGAASTGGGGAGENVITYNTLKFSDPSGAAFPPILGQRDPKVRYELLGVDFTGKSHLDIGCNSGGMILGQLPNVRKAVGVDFDQTAIHTADGIRTKLGLGTDVVEFHTFDLNKPAEFPLDSLLQYGATSGKYDIISLFAVNMWIDDPVRVINWAADHARIFIIEINGDDAAKSTAINALNAKCPAGSVEKTDSSRCPDCNERRLFTCAIAV